MATNSAPISSESGLSQLVTASPAALPVGTRPPAIAPTTVPMKNGVSSDAKPNDDWASARPRKRPAVLWNANPAPRKTMPRAARLSGMNSVEKMASNAAENAVQSTTSTNTSQTWLASQTGPIAQSISSRGRRPRDPPPASRLHSPAPKSAPPKTAYIVTPIQSTTATASALLTPVPPSSRSGRRAPRAPRSRASGAPSPAA